MNKKETALMSDEEILTKVKSIFEIKPDELLDMKKFNDVFIRGEYPLNVLAGIYMRVYKNADGKGPAMFDKYFEIYGVNDGLDLLMQSIGEHNRKFINDYFKSKNERDVIDNLSHIPIFSEAISKASNQNMLRLAIELITHSKQIINNENDIDMDLD